MNTKKVVYLGLLGGMAFILMGTFSIPILPAAPYLRFEPGEIPGIIAACLMGPWAGVMVNAVKDILYFFLRARSIFGPIGDFVATASFAFIMGLIYYNFRSNRGFIIAAVAASIGRVLVMIPANLIILGLQFGMSPMEVMDIMLPVIVPFNLIKSSINSVGAFIIIRLILVRVPSLMKT